MIAPINPMLSYVIHPHHRNNNPNKSQWTIAEAAETACFRRSEQEQWLFALKGWGLHLVGDEPQLLGVCRDRGRRTIVARFVGDANSGDWHGYPADPVACVQDIPIGEVRRVWLERKLVSKPALRKITCGQSCSL